MLVAASADPRIEASCRYARSADERERDRFISDIERHMAGDTIWMGLDLADDSAPSYSIVHTWTADVTAPPTLVDGDTLEQKITLTFG